ncbi:hypothetical protein HYC85_007687 [Camellia sinensis]|uniref:Uncharacterized protein n=1 Tax=Camellia sinensis TaxID=4442 RepID=A0A7J7HRJ3_CAMSI|nr:hypothetical protein HYC85_007687 [Camellia sinensis]
MMILISAAKLTRTSMDEPKSRDTRYAIHSEFEDTNAYPNLESRNIERIVSDSSINSHESESVLEKMIDKRTLHAFCAEITD